MLFLSLLEALAFVALIPLMQLLTAPNMQTTSSSVTFASDLFGNPSPEHLALMLAVITVGVYIVKSFAADRDHPLGDDVRARGRDRDAPPPDGHVPERALLGCTSCATATSSYAPFRSRCR